MKFSFEFLRGSKVEKEARSPLTSETPITESQIATASRAATVVPSGMRLGDASAVGEPPNPGPLPVASPPETGGGSTTPVQSAPIRWPFQYATNQTLTPRGEDRRLTPFQQLRAIADMSDVMRIAIEARKDHVSGLKWDFAPKRLTTADKPSDEQLRKIDALRLFFLKPDRVHDFDTWIRMATEDVLVVDALSIFRRRTRGGQLFSLDIIDGTTIKPLIDGRGFTPMPPSVAYRQIIQGRPVKGGDCTVDQMLYRPRTVRSWTPYGLSATECVLLTVNTALNRQLFNLSYYAEGNVPEGLMSTPEGWTTEQIREFQTYWDSMLVGNARARSRLRFVGPKMAESIHQFKKESFDTQFDEWLLRVVCAAYGVQPQELGFTQDVNRASGEQQENVTYRRSVKPLAKFFKSIIDDVVATDMGAPDIEAVFTGGESEDRLAQARIDDLYVRVGKVSIDELRRRDGEEPVGLGPMIYTSTGPVFVEQLIASKDDDDSTSDPKNPDPPADDTGDGAKPKPGQKPAPADDAGDDEHDTAQKAVDGELSAFKRWCVARVKVGKAIDAANFKSDELPVETREQIVAAIAASGGTVGDVVDVFDTVAKSIAATKLKTNAQRRYRKVLKSTFSDLATALATHMRDGIGA